MTNNQRAIQAFNDIRNVASIPTGTVIEDYPPLIQSKMGNSQQVFGGKWARPPQRPPIPETINPNEMYWLYGLEASNPNDFAVYISGNTEVEWVFGTGIKETFPNGTLISHSFIYDDVDIIPGPYGIKWFWIKITGTNITTVNLNVRPTSWVTGSTQDKFFPQVYEWHWNLPELSANLFGATIFYTEYRFLDLFVLHGDHKMTNLDNFMKNCVSLKVPPIMSFKGVLSVVSFCYSLYSLDVTELILDFPDATALPGIYSYLYSMAPMKVVLNAPKCLSLANSFAQNANFSPETIEINAPVCTTISGIFAGNATMSKIELNSPLLNDAAISFMINALKSIRIFSMNAKCIKVDVQRNQLDIDDIMTLCDDLYDRTSLLAGIVDIRKSRAVSPVDKLTTEKIARFTAKNWTVTKV